MQSSITSWLNYRSKDVPKSILEDVFSKISFLVESKEFEVIQFLSLMVFHPDTIITLRQVISRGPLSELEIKNIIRCKDYKYLAPHPDTSLLFHLISTTNKNYASNRLSIPFEEIRISYSLAEIIPVLVLISEQINIDDNLKLEYTIFTLLLSFYIMEISNQSHQFPSFCTSFPLMDNFFELVSHFDNGKLISFQTSRYLFKHNPEDSNFIPSVNWILAFLNVAKKSKIVKGIENSQILSYTNGLQNLLPILNKALCFIVSGNKTYKLEIQHKVSVRLCNEKAKRSKRPADSEIEQSQPQKKIVYLSEVSTTPITSSGHNEKPVTYQNSLQKSSVC